MTEIKRGYKGKLADTGCSSSLSVDIKMAAALGASIDVVCFGVDSNGKLSDDRYMVFYNQESSPKKEIVFSTANNQTTFGLNLDDLPLAVDKLVFAASIDGEGTMRGLGASSVNLGASVFSFDGSLFDAEKAVIICEIYRRDNIWRFGAVAQGFAGGLSALLSHYGGEEASSSAAPCPVPEPKKVSLSKITLTKASERHTVSLVKGGAAPKKLIVRATWQDNGDGYDGNDDLDLRVGILLSDGRMKIVCAPDHPGAIERAPYVHHMGDVQVASEKAKATETVEVNSDIAALSGGRVALVFSVYSAVGNGAVSVASLRPVMRMEYGEQVVECAYDFTKIAAAKDDTVYTYVIGTAVIDGDKIILGPSGLTSKPGSENTPWLRWDGGGVVVDMAGPAIFKGGDASNLNTKNPNRYS